jgi:hypothetical protein
MRLRKAVRPGSGHTALLIILVLLASTMPAGCGGSGEKRSAETTKRRGHAPEDELILSRELAREGADTSYKVDVYYSRLHKRVRVDVHVDGKHLRNLYNRFRLHDVDRPITLELGREDDVDTVVFRQGGLSAYIRLQEDPLNVQAMYDALEKYVEEHTRDPGWREAYVRGHAGLLEQTYLGGIRRYDIHPCPPSRFLVTEDGTVTPLTSEKLVIAYRKAGIEAETSEDRERISKSIIELVEPGGAIISGLDGIPGYQRHPLDADVEGAVRAPWSYKDEGGTVCWICYTYTRNQGRVTRYKIRFSEGRILLNPVDQLILGGMIGDYYLPE